MSTTACHRLVFTRLLDQLRLLRSCRIARDLGVRRCPAQGDALSRVAALLRCARCGTTIPDSPAAPTETPDLSSTPPADSAPLSGSSSHANSSPTAPACSMPSALPPSGSGSRAGPPEPAEKDTLAYTPRPAHGPPARGITTAQLQRGLRSICTECKRAQSVSSNVSICPEECPCPWARRPSAHPG